MLLAISWRYWQAGKIHASLWRFRFASCKRALHWNPSGSHNKKIRSNTFLTEYCSLLLYCFICIQWLTYVERSLVRILVANRILDGVGFFLEFSLRFPGFLFPSTQFLIYIYIYIYVCVCVCVPTYVLAVVKWADGFSGVPRISRVLGRTVSGSTFRWHLSHLFLDLFLLQVEVGILRKFSRL